jgi:glycosyltransferase 2 family protein
LVIVPIAGIVGAVPLTPSGLGTTELVIEELYKRMPGVKVMPGDGTLVGIGRRATDIAVALIGLAFYLANRSEVQEVYAEAEHIADEESASLDDN